MFKHAHFAEDLARPQFRKLDDVIAFLNGYKQAAFLDLKGRVGGRALFEHGLAGGANQPLRPQWRAVGKVILFEIAIGTVVAHNVSI